MTIVTAAVQLHFVKNGPEDSHSGRLKLFFVLNDYTASDCPLLYDHDGSVADSCNNSRINSGAERRAVDQYIIKIFSADIYQLIKSIFFKNFRTRSVRLSTKTIPDE